MIQMHFARDFAEMLRELSDAEVEFLVIGAHALAAHGHPRNSKDFDIWVRPSPDNAQRVWRALVRFGAPLHQLTVEDLSVPGTVFQMGQPPLRIDILTSIRDVTFEEAWPNRIEAKMGDGTYPVIGKVEFIRNKRAVGRDQDIVDANLVERQ
jgi:hypothetical protein